MVVRRISASKYLLGGVENGFLVSVQNDRIYFGQDLVPNQPKHGAELRLFECFFVDANFCESLFLCIFHCHVLREYVWRHLGVDLFPIWFHYVFFTVNLVDGWWHITHILVVMPAAGESLLTRYQTQNDTAPLAARYQQAWNLGIRLHDL